MLTHPHGQSQETAGVVQVQCRPGKPLMVKTIPSFRKVSGQVAGTSQDREFLCSAVKSVIPEEEYQNDLDPFRESIRAAGRVTADGVVDGSEICLDVTDSNHVPMDIFGTEKFEDGIREIEIGWQAMLVGLVTIRVKDSSGNYPIHRIATFAIYQDGVIQ